MSHVAFSELLEASAARHGHLCPRQVLGVRIALAGASHLELGIPRSDKHLLIILETDGCFADGIEVATGCTVGHRTLRVEDYGKIAATFMDVETEQAIRVAPRLDARQMASAYMTTEPRHYFAQLQAYQSMPDEMLLMIQSVRLKTSVTAILSRPGRRVNCEMCGEEIINERTTRVDGRVLCHACAHGGYYSILDSLPVSFPASQLAEVPKYHALI